MPDQIQRRDPDGVPFVVAQSAETRGRRLYVDGEPFPWATSGEASAPLRVERGSILATLWVPILVEGPVTITPAPHRGPGRAREQETPVVFPPEGENTEDENTDA